MRIISHGQLNHLIDEIARTTFEPEQVGDMDVKKFIIRNLNQLHHTLCAQGLHDMEEVQYGDSKAKGAYCLHCKFSWGGIYAAPSPTEPGVDV